MTDSDAESDVLDLSGRRLHRIEVPPGLDPATIICDKNNVSKIENLERCHNLKQLSLSGNRLVRMTGIGKLKNLTVLNLPNNSIVAVEGLKELLQLEWLNLSGNSIKAMENLNTNISLGHLDLSDNSISSLSDITHLRSLRTLLLHGNILTSLRTVPQHFPKSIAILSLAENEIGDINEVMYLSCLPYLEQLSLTNNPCVLMTASTPYPCLYIHVLDGYLIRDKERLKAEWIYCQGKGRHFKPGQHVEVVEYLASVCPLTNSAELQMQFA
ncbi:centrosomal protein of 97 kDa-like [Pecten maximus]|uniref:centrosomal protein of 97 kDa-like n=1 Tax=Pecten maximus TaxID=6579 RepID=UPI001457F439|nr:centrosomal protein of 97 kDa-like [Pecten maximus]